jgi:hypothetical protein
MNTLTKFISAVILGIVLLTTIIYFIVRPSKAGLLCKTTWCIDHIYYKNKLGWPKTKNAMYIVYTNGNIPCYENAIFKNNGDISLPGINSRSVDGGWKLNDDGDLQLSVDTLNTSYQYTYSVEVSQNNLVLKSTQTTIYAHRDRTAMPNLF